MDKLKSIPVIIALGYSTVAFPIYVAATQGLNIWIVLAILANLYLLYQIGGFVKWIVSSGIVNMLGLGGKLK